MGLYGEEGLQAVQSADFSLANFRFLWKLILIEGRSNHIRVSKFILLFLFKNVAFTAAQFVFGFFCNWSGQTIYDDFYITLYNVLFTAFTISYLGGMDQDIRYRTYLSSKDIKAKEEKYGSRKDKDLYVNSLGELSASDHESMIPMKEMRVDKLVKNNFQHFYYITQKGLFFNYTVFCFEILSALINASLITVATIYFYGDHEFDSNGHSSDFWTVSFAIYTVLILATNLLTLIRASHISLLLLFAVFVTSVIPFFLFAFFYDRMVSINTQSTYSYRFIIARFNYYSVVLLSTIFICFVEIVKFFGKYYFNPTMVEYVKQLKKNNIHNDKKYFADEYVKLIKRKNLKKPGVLGRGQDEEHKLYDFVSSLTRGEMN